MLIKAYNGTDDCGVVDDDDGCVVDGGVGCTVDCGFVVELVVEVGRPLCVSFWASNSDSKSASCNSLSSSMQ